MLKKIIYSPFTKKIYDQVKDFPFLKNILVPLANSKSHHYLENTKKKLNKISPSMCSAKWLQSTIHLELAETHSCHHPKRHRIDTVEVAKNPSALHNTKEKIEFRTQMINGDYPSECEYCWRVEKNGDYSDRIYKSSADWAQVNLSQLASLNKIENINPSYLEVSFSSDCNLKCAYCDPTVSSAIRHEIQKLGPYPTSDRFGNLDEYQPSPNDLSAAFWQWWDGGLKDDLKVLRVTGGEPLLSPDLFKLIERLEYSDQKFQFDFAVNSNLMVGPELIKKFITNIRSILKNKKIKSFLLYTSIDTWGEQAEFLRYGLKTKQFINNIETCLNVIPDLELTFMVTYQALSPFNFNQLLEFILDLRKRYPISKIKIGISNMINPSFLSVSLFDQSFLPYIENNLNFMKSHQLTKNYPHGFSNFEIQHLERIQHSFKHHPQHPKEEMDNFKKFISEYEMRKKLNFKEVFKNADDFLKTIN